MEDNFAPLIDVSGLSVSELLSMAEKNSALQASLQRVAKDVEDPNGVLSAFSSFVS